MPLVERRDALRFLAGPARPRLLAAARRASPRHAEDAVQDVLCRLAAGAGDLPGDPAAATAYAAVAAGRRATALAVAERPAREVDDGDAASTADDPLEALERRRAVAAFLAALDGLPPRTRAALALDAAGWPREAVGRAVGASGRAVKRMVDAHRAQVLATAVRALDGSDCARLAATLAAYGAGAGAPRADGTVARHLELCDACRAALAAERRTRRALAALLPLPLAGAPGPLRRGHGSGGGHALAVKAVAVALVAAGGGAVALRASQPGPAPAVVRGAAPAAPRLVLAPAASRPGAAARAAGATAARAGARALHGAALPARRPAPPRTPGGSTHASGGGASAAGGCGYGTLRDCGTQGALGSLGG